MPGYEKYQIVYTWVSTGKSMTREEYESFTNKTDILI